MRALAGVLCLVAAGAAGSVELIGPGGAPPPPLLALEPLSLAELGGRSRAGLGGAVGSVRAVGRGLEASLSMPELPEPVTVVERELPLAFRLRAPDGLPPRLRAEWVGADGRPGARLVEGEAQPGEPVRVRVLGPWPVGSDERGTVYEGRLLIELPLAGITRSGRLSGRIQLQAEPGP